MEHLRNRTGADQGTAKGESRCATRGDKTCLPAVAAITLQPATQATALQRGIVSGQGVAFPFTPRSPVDGLVSSWRCVMPLMDRRWLLLSALAFVSVAAAVS